MVLTCLGFVVERRSHTIVWSNASYLSLEEAFNFRVLVVQ